MPPQVIHKSGRRGSRLPVTHNKEVLTMLGTFFATASSRFSSRRASLFRLSLIRPLSYPSLSPTLSVKPTRTPGCDRGEIAEKAADAFFPAALRRKTELSIDEWNGFEEQLNHRSRYAFFLRTPTLCHDAQRSEQSR